MRARETVSINNFFPNSELWLLDFVQTRIRRYGDLDLSGDLHAISCKTASFDAVMNVEVLEHSAGTGGGPQGSIICVLKPGWRLYFRPSARMGRALRATKHLLLYAIWPSLYVGKGRLW